MNQNIFIIIIFVMQVVLSNQKVLRFENMLRSSLSEYNLLPSIIKENSSTFVIQMQDDVKEHLGQIQITDENSQTEDLIHLDVSKSVSEPFSKKIYFMEECLQEQALVYQGLFQRIFTSPKKEVNFVNLGDIIHYFKYVVPKNKLSIENFCVDGVHYIKFKSWEADILLIKIQQQTYVNQDMIYDTDFTLKLIYSLNNDIIFDVYKINAFPELNTPIKIQLADIIQTDQYVGENRKILYNIMKSLPNDYDMRNVYLDQIQYDFQLGAKSQFLKLKTFNGAFVFASTYVENEDYVGIFELRIFRIDNYFSENYKLYEKNIILKIQFFRMKEIQFQQLLSNLKLDEILNTVGYEIAQIYIQGMQSLKQHVLNKNMEYNHEIQANNQQPQQTLSKFMTRQVVSTDQKQNQLYTLNYTCVSKFAKVQIIDNITDDQYNIDFDVKFYNKDTIKNFVQASLQINKRISEF